MEDFPIIIIDWIKNTEDLRYRMDIVEEEFNGYSVYKDGDKKNVHSSNLLYDITDAVIKDGLDYLN